MGKNVKHHRTSTADDMPPMPAANDTVRDIIAEECGDDVTDDVYAAVVDSANKVCNVGLFITADAQSPDYLAVVRRKARHLADVLSRDRTGEPAGVAAAMSLLPHEVAPEVNSDAHRKSLRMGTLRVGDNIESNTEERCEKCGGKCFRRTVQMRSMDEGESVILACLDRKCDHVQIFK